MQLETTIRPWVNVPKVHGSASCPWELRHWTFNPKNGYVVHVDEECKFDEDDRRWIVTTNRDSIPLNWPVLDYPTVDRIFAHAEKHRVKMANAVLAVLGTQDLTPAYAEACKQSPDIYAKGGEPKAEEPVKGKAKEAAGV